jgi:hypothetical protein
MEIKGMTGEALILALKGIQQDIGQELPHPCFNEVQGGEIEFPVTMSAECCRLVTKSG